MVKAGVERNSRKFEKLKFVVFFAALAVRETPVAPHHPRVLLNSVNASSVRPRRLSFSMSNSLSFSSCRKMGKVRIEIQARQ